MTPPPTGVAATAWATLFMNFEPLLDPNNYYRAWHRIEAVSGWKTGTKQFGLSLSTNILRLIGDIARGEYCPAPFSVFPVSERGHVRLVKALSVRDCLLQHVLCEDVLIPGLRPFLIHDNGASLRGKGISFTRRRLERHLRWHMARHGTQGYILKVDFQKFFDNIPHAQLVDAICQRLPDPRLAALLRDILRAGESDISYITEPDERRIVFSSLDHAKVPPSLLTGQRFLHKGLGIGAPLSQVAGIFYPTPIDNWCKSVMGVHCYGRYMDDIYAIGPSKRELLGLLAGIREQAAALGLSVHPDKTSITPIAHGFSYLKTRYTLTPTGGIVRRLARDTVTRERRKIRHLASLVAGWEIPLSVLHAQWRSWVGDKKAYAARRTISDLKHLYEKEIENALLAKGK